MGFVKEFKEFAMRGNLVDMAVAVIMAGAFGKVVTAFIDGMVMPVIGKVISGVDFKAMAYTLSEATKDASGKDIPAVTIKYGAFITEIIDFTLVALVVFMFIKMMNRMKKKAEEAPAAPPAPSKEETLLTEIRDILKNK